MAFFFFFFTNRLTGGSFFPSLPPSLSSFLSPFISLGTVDLVRAHTHKWSTPELYLHYQTTSLGDKLV